MPKAYFSTVLDQPAGEVWGAIRAFDEYSWADRTLSAEMEDGRDGDAVGGVRRVETGDGLIRQRLLAHSDRDRSYTYEFCDPIPFAIRDYVATLRVAAVVDGDRAFVDWSATFDCAPGELEHWIAHFEGGFERWLSSLRSWLNGEGGPRDQMPVNSSSLWAALRRTAARITGVQPSRSPTGPSAWRAQRWKLTHRCARG